jgi:hypothetical protein
VLVSCFGLLVGVTRPTYKGLVKDPLFIFMVRKSVAFLDSFHVEKTMWISFLTPVFVDCVLNFCCASTKFGVLEIAV